MRTLPPEGFLIFALAFGFIFFAALMIWSRILDKRQARKLSDEKQLDLPYSYHTHVMGFQVRSRE